MSRRIFVDSKIKEQSAYFGWQDKGTALYGLKEGYKNAADNIVEVALEKGTCGDIKTLDTYIFPVVFSYRHCIEISLKHIYMRCFGELPSGGHDLLILWDKIKADVVEGFINSKDSISNIKEYKRNFVEWKIDDIDLGEIRRLIKELQGADCKADVWRYLMSKDTELYFTEWKFVDYTILKETINYLYDVLEYVYFIVDEYLSL